MPQNQFTRSLMRDYALSLAIAILMAATSGAGLLAPNILYPTEDLRQAFVANDVVNLLLGLPVLLGSLVLSRRGEPQRDKLFGLLCWPGALLYTLYNYVAYAVAMPLTWPFVLYLALVGSSAYALIRLITRIDGLAVQQQLGGRVPARLAGGVLAGLGTLFFLRAAGLIGGALVNQTPIAAAELAVLVADLLITPLWVIGGIALWRRRAFGYVTGTGLLFQASMLFVALLIFFVLRPFLAAVPFPVEDFVVILVMGLICFIPFGLFVRGLAAEDKRAARENPGD